jgi:hypothetical protein
MEQIENNDPRVEDLREVTCVEDQEADMLSGYMDPATGTFKMRPAKATIKVPENPEELRNRHRRIAIAWAMLATKHTNRSWLGAGHIECFRKLSDHILGRHIAGLSSTDSYGNTLKPSWNQVLLYDHEVRKEAYKRIRHGEATDIPASIQSCCTDPTLMQLYFLVPLTLSAATGRSSSSTSAPSNLQREPKGSGKSKNPKGPGRPVFQPPSSSSVIKTQGKTGVRYCYKYNSSKGCAGGCGYDHVCQRCRGAHPRQKCIQKGGKDTTKA